MKGLTGGLVGELQMGRLRIGTMGFVSVLFTNVPTGHATSEPGFGQQQQGDDTSQNCLEAHGEATWVESTEQPGSCQNDHCYDISHAQPEHDTFELQAPRSSFPQRNPSVARDWSAIQQLADRDQGYRT